MRDRWREEDESGRVKVVVVVNEEVELLRFRNAFREILTVLAALVVLLQRKARQDSACRGSAATAAIINR